MRKIYTSAKYFFIFSISLICFNNSATAQNPVLAYTSVVTGLSAPVDAVFAPGDGRMFIAQKNGLIRVRSGSTLTTFADIGPALTSPAAGEQGLLSLAFHPDYATNRYFFVLHTGANGAITVSRYRRDASNPNTIEAGGTILLSIPKPTPVSSYTNHNGGKILFGTDGYLYISTGDGGSGGDPGNNAQNRTSLLGKMLRIDVNGFATAAPFYSIPSTNPYASPTDGFRDEIYSYGLRNPWRWSFDRLNGDMWIADVGQSAWEEINWIPAGEASGGNFGWRCYEGAHVYGPGGCTLTDTISPIFEYGRSSSNGGTSISGGVVYRGALLTALQGFYVVADYTSGNIWKIRPNGSGGWQTFLQNGLPNGVVGFAESPTGELYSININQGRVDSLIITTVLPVSISNFSAVAKTGFNELSWSTSVEVNTARFHVEYGTDGSNFTRVGTVAASGNSSGSNYNYRHNIVQNGFVYYRLAAEDTDGSINYSDIVKLNLLNAKSIKVYPNIISNYQFNIDVLNAINEVQLINANGAVVFRKNMQATIGTVLITLPVIPKGMYVLRAVGNNSDTKEKIFIQ